MPESGEQFQEVEIRESSVAQEQRPLIFDSLLEDEVSQQHIEITELDAPKAKELEKQFGVNVRENSNKYEYFFVADGKEHTILETEATDSALERSTQVLEEKRDQLIADLSSGYNVSFAQPGEDATRYRELSSNCRPEYGNMVKAKSPTFPQLLATGEALAHAQPSQLIASDQNRLKIYFLDEQIAPSPYGNKPALGVYFDNHQRHQRALMITPDGGQLPPTENDTTNNEDRNLKQVIMHEVVHNGIENLWPTDIIPTQLSTQLGWRQVGNGHNVLEGKDGFYYSHGRHDGCDKPTTWFKLNQRLNPVDVDGNVVRNWKETHRPSNQELMGLSKVRPASYYFPNPEEMLTEAVTLYRMGEDSRAKLLQESPLLYSTAKQFDQYELSRFYGVLPDGKSRYVRSSSGILTKRSNQAEQDILDFEQRHQ